MKRFLVVGGGSMGKRRIRCLLANGIDPTCIRLAELRDERRDQVQKDYGVASFAQFDDAMQWDPQVAIVSVPGAFHMQFCLAAARAGKHIFCEVPLSINFEGVEELSRLAAQKQLIVAPGCQLPFDPLVRQTKQWIDDTSFGPALIYHELFGAYLPDWHPYEDYRSFYAASQKMGGGNLDVIAQELTGARWMTGRSPQQVFAQGSHLSSLEIDGHDCHQIVASGGGMSWTLQFDLIQRPGGGQRKIISENGTLEIQGAQARRYLAQTGRWETFERPAGFEHEQIYRDEIAHFLRCVEGQEEWIVPLPAAIETVSFLLAMQQSIETQRVVELARECIRA